MKETIDCPNCEEEIDIEDFYQSLRELGLEDGDYACEDEEVTCKNCGSLIKINGSCSINVHVDIEEPELLLVGEVLPSELSDGSHEVNGKIVTIVNGEVENYFALSDENQFSLFEEGL